MKNATDFPTSRIGFGCLSVNEAATKSYSFLKGNQYLTN